MRTRRRARRGLWIAGVGACRAGERVWTRSSGWSRSLARATSTSRPSTSTRRSTADDGIALLLEDLPNAPVELADRSGRRQGELRRFEAKRFLGLLDAHEDPLRQR